MGTVKDLDGDGPTHEHSGPSARMVWPYRLGGAALRIGVPLVGIPLLINLLMPRNPPPGIFLHGGIIGALYGLIAMGLILVYRATGIINFAQGSLGAVPAVLGLTLISRRNLPFVVAIPIVFIGAATIGAAVEFFVIRRFQRAPRLILAVVTLGVAQFLAFIELFIPRWVSGEILPPTDFPTPFSGFRFAFGLLNFSGNHIMTVMLILVALAGLWAFFRYTDVGIAVRASAENADRAALLGIPVRRLSTVVWAIAAVISALGVFLRAPLVGVQFGGLIGPSIFLFAFTAAVVARMQSLSTALISGMAIGIIDQSAVFSTRRSTISYSIMLIVILLALLAQRARFPRAYTSGISTWRSVKEFRPVPRELRHIREVVVALTSVRVLVIGLTLSIPFIPYFAGPGQLGLVTVVLIYAMVGVSLVILTGWAGQISLGQFAIAGVGAAVAGGMNTYLDADFFITLLAAGVVGSLVAILIGVPALRIPGLFLASTTLAFAFSVQHFVLNRDYFGWLLPGRDNRSIERPLLFSRFDLNSDVAFFYVCLAFLGLALSVASALRHGRSGRLFIGARDNGQAAQAFGIDLVRTRLAPFAISGFIAALAGALLAYQSRAIDDLTFTPAASIEVFTMTVIGGVATLSGAVLGAIYLKGIPYFLEPLVPGIGLLATGMGLLLLLLLLPGGLAEAMYRVRDGFVRRIARKHGVAASTLIAATEVTELSTEARASAAAEAQGPVADESVTAGGKVDGTRKRAPMEPISLAVRRKGKPSRGNGRQRSGPGRSEL